MELHLALNSRNLKMASLALALSATLVTTSHAREIYYDGSNPDLLVKRQIVGNYLKGYKTLYVPGESSNNNKIIVNKEKIDFNVVGGYSFAVNGDYNGNPLGSRRNELDITGDIQDGAGIAGGYFQGRDEGEVEGNIVNVKGRNNGVIYGGYGASKDNLNIINNKVTVIGDNYADGFNNFVGNMYGGYGLTGNMEVSYNEVELIGNHSGNNIVGGVARYGNANKNRVSVTGNMGGGKPIPRIIGGWAGEVIEEGGSEVEASGNIITFSGELIRGEIIGGQVGTGVHHRINSKAEDNIITIHNTSKVKVEGAAKLYGGLGGNKLTDNKNHFKGNTLVFSGGPLKVKEIANFENYHFWINPSLKGASEAHLSADEVYLGTKDGLLSSKFGVVGVLQGESLNVNDSFLLLEANKMIGNGVGSTSEVGQLQQGISVIYDVKTTIDQDSGKVLATILGEDKEEEMPGIDQGGKDEEGFTPIKPAGRINPQLKALSEGNLANLMLVSRGADIAAYTAFDTIKAQNEGGLNTFILMEGGHSRYSSGSHIKSNDFHLMTGVSLRQDSITAAAFVEAGWGDYDTYNSFTDVANVNGDGKSRYVGVGVLGKYDFANGVYVDGSFRIGSSHNKFNASDIKNTITGEEARYSFSRTYVSAHAGLGYIYDIDSTNAIDFSAKYLWTHLGSKNLTVAGDNLKFKSLDSNRAQLRATWNHQANDSIKLKAGVGYEYEFSAKAKATALDMYSVNAPSVKGSTGIATLGINVNPESNKRLDVDFNINGYTGKRQGVSANIKVGYNF